MLILRYIHRNGFGVLIPSMFNLKPTFLRLFPFKNVSDYFTSQSRSHCNYALTEILFSVFLL